MIKKRVSTISCKVGDIIAEEVFDNSGLLLIVRNAVITDFVKKRLLEINIPNIMIYELSMTEEDSAKKNYLDNIVAIKKIFEEVAAGKKIEYESVLDLSEKVYCWIGLSSSPNIVHFLNEVCNYDEYTYTHSLKTAFYSMFIAKWLGFDEHEIKKVIQCGLLHDVGKVKIPKEILDKKGVLTKDEYELIKRHTILGYELIADIYIDKDVKQTVLLHHERMDGSGYPFGTKSDMVGVNARIVAVADVFDAMTSDRVYKKRVSPFQVFEMFKTVGIGMFDIAIVNKFMTNISSFYIGMKVLLNNGLIGEIAYVPPHDILNPVIHLDQKYVDLSRDTTIKIACIV